MDENSLPPAPGPDEASPPQEPPPLPEPSPPPLPVEHRFVFNGDGAEYFRIWIVNLALSIVTIGIYSAWAKVRRLKYLHGATSLDGSAFGYHGDPLKILKGRIIGVVLFGGYTLAGRIHPFAGLAAALVLFLAVPWLMVRSMMFRTRMTSWRGLRLNFRDDYAGAYRTYVGWMLLALFTLWLLFPQFIRKSYQYLIDNTRVGSTPMQCDAPLGPFYSAALQAFGLLMLLGVGAAFVMPALGIEPGKKPNMALIGVLYVAFLLLYAVAIGLFQAKVMNTVFNHATIGPHRLKSELQWTRLSGIYVTNLLGIVLTLGLFIPWATIRLLRYRMDSLALVAHGPLDEFVAAQAPGGTSAVGEEISDIFDVDFGL